MTTTLYSGGRLFDGENAPLDGQAVLVEDTAIRRVAPPRWRDVVRRRLSVDGALSDQCSQAINRWYSRL